MPDYLQQYFTLDNIIQIGISLAILLVFLILRKLFTRYFFNLLFNLTNRPKTEILNRWFWRLISRPDGFLLPLGCF